MSAPPDSDATAGRILVVDDDESIRFAIQRSLRRLGYEVAEAADGEAGLQQISTFDPHLVFLDLRMPGIDGHTFLRRLKSLGTKTSVVVMSGRGEMDDVVDVLRAGSVDYLKKPWSPSDLMAAVTRGFDVWEKRQSVASAGTPGPAAAVEQKGRQSRFDEVVARARAGDIRLPTIPAVLSDLRALMLQPEASLSEVARRIESDPQLASEVLRIANTAYYARLGRSHDLRTAVGRVGFRQTYTLVETIFASGLWKVSDPVARQMLSAIWKRSLAQAVTMRAITEMVATRGEISSDTAYLIGLFSEVGASFLVSVASECGGLATEGDASLRAAMHEHHAALGASILQRWKFAPQITAAVREHHGASAGAGSNPYWPVAVIGGDMADDLVRDSTTTAERRDRSFVASRMADLGFSEPLRRKVLEDVKAEFLSLSQVS